MSTIVIRYDGVDITSRVVIKEAEFTAFVNGAPGPFSLKVKDVGFSSAFVSGKEVTLDIDGTRHYGGFCMSVKRLHVFPVDLVARAQRFWVLEGYDYNLLLQKRFLYDHVNLSNVALRSWPVGSHDDVVIKYVFDNYTDLGADGVTYNGVTHVGTPNPDKAGVIGAAGWSMLQALASLNRGISAAYFINPDKDLNFVDVDIPSNSIGLSDLPSPGSSIGYREFERAMNGSNLVNDQLLWGMGQGSAHAVFSRVEDAASIDLHGRWQNGEVDFNLFRQTSADLRASTFVYGTPQSKRGGKDDQVSWQATTYQPTFRVGERVAIESNVFGIADVVPIRKMKITFPNKTRARFDMILSHDIDQPWDIFEFFFPQIGIDKPPPPVIPVGEPPPGGGLPGGGSGAGSIVYHARDLTGSSWVYRHDLYVPGNDFGADGPSGSGEDEEWYPYGGSPSTPYALATSSPHFPIVSEWQNSQFFVFGSPRINGRGLSTLFMSFPLPQGAYRAVFHVDYLQNLDETQERNARAGFADPGSHPIILRSGVWDGQPGRPLDFGTTVATSSLRTGQTITIPFVAEFPDWALWELDVDIPFARDQAFLGLWFWWVGGNEPFNQLVAEGWADQARTDDVYSFLATPALQADRDALPPGSFPNNDLPTSRDWDSYSLTVYYTTPSSPTNGLFCEDIVAVSSDRLTWGTSWRYILGSTRIYVGGVLQRNGYDYVEVNPDTGVIRFLQAPPLLERVTCCYSANGSF